jgi:hypothetical protein
MFVTTVAKAYILKRELPARLTPSPFNTPRLQRRRSDSGQQILDLPSKGRKA